MQTVTLSGFAEPPRDSQVTFRAMLAAIAEPGLVQRVELALDAPAPLGRALASACLTLLDFETPVWLAPGIGKAAGDWIAFHTGAPLATDPAAAAFAVLAEGDDLLPLDRFALGSDESPELGASLLVQVRGVAADAGAVWFGPGIETTRRVAVDGIDARFWPARAALAPLFPRGLDIFFCAGDRVVALPRTTKVEG
ncbi:phosphonate C-P lyase system protein PhnH [Desertibaculum subflavum]|uniref:phosphonate C-P lyase system protein PhnH n=1 Tax=Desertibaculum subflavum TaxID=2268458 RepID=UPI0034D29946